MREMTTSIFYPTDGLAITTLYAMSGVFVFSRLSYKNRTFCFDKSCLVENMLFDT